MSYLMIFSYSLSLPLESRQRLYMMDASTLAGLYVLGSFSNEITDSRIVLAQKSINHPKTTIALRQFLFSFCFATLYLPDILRRIPPLARQLATLWIIYGWMQDWYAQITVLHKERNILRLVSIFFNIFYCTLFIFATSIVSGALFCFTRWIEIQACYFQKFCSSHYAFACLLLLDLYILNNCSLFKI